MKPKILITEATDFSPLALALLETIGEVSIEDFDRKTLLEQVQTAHTLWVRLGHYIDGEVIEAARKLQYIVTPTTGLNHIDMSAAEDGGVSVLSLRGDVDFLRTIPATAEHTIGLILALLRNIPSAVQSVKRGEWKRDDYKGNELSGKTVGLVGYGRIGQIVARYLAAFDVNVIATDPFVDPGKHREVSFMPLRLLLAEADIISLHVSLSPETSNLIGLEEISLLKDNALLVNTSRGELIDEVALLAALEAKLFKGAALDVMSEEHTGHIEENSLIEYANSNENLIITPHIGGCTAESMSKTELYMAQKLVQEIS